MCCVFELEFHWAQATTFDKFRYKNNGIMLFVQIKDLI